MKTRIIPISFEGGLNEFQEASALPAGYAAQLQNWIPEVGGSLRVPRGWLSASTTGLSGTRTCRGLGYYVPAAGAKFMAAQASSGTQYQLWSIPASNIAAGTWTAVETVTSNPSTRPLAMAAGAGYLLYCSPEFPSQRIRRWDGTTASDASTDAIAGRTLVYHNNRFFTGGATANPTYLRWSELGDSATWTIDTNFQAVGQDDGEPIEDLLSWDRNLFIGKQNSIQALSGFGPDTFALHPLDGGGCAPGRTLVSTPKGICAIGRKRVWFYAGGGFDPISQPIESSYGMSGNYMSGAYVDDNILICDEGSGTVWVFDMNTKAWHTEVFGTPNEGPGILANRADYLLGGVRVGSTNSLVDYRQIPGSPRARIVGSAQTFIAKTPEMWLGEASHPTTIVRMHFQIRQRGGTSASTPLTVKCTHDGVLHLTQTIPLKNAVGVFHARLACGKDGYSHQIECSQVVGSAEACVLDLEDLQAEAEVEAPR